MGLGLLGPSIVFLSHFPSFFIPFSISLFFFRFHFISFVPFCPPFVSFAFFHSPFVFSLFLIALFTPLHLFHFFNFSFISFVPLPSFSFPIVLPSLLLFHFGPLRFFRSIHSHFPFVFFHFLSPSLHFFHSPSFISFYFYFLSFLLFPSTTLSFLSFHLCFFPP